MKCEKISLRIEEFHDNQLDSSWNRLISKHLRSCPSCSADLREFQELSVLLNRSSTPLPSPALAKSLADAIKTRSEPKQRWKKIFIGSIRIPKPILAASTALVVMLIIGANILGRNTSDHYWRNLSAILTLESPKAVAKTKVVRVPVIKTIEVPVIKERIVKRIVYISRNPVNKNLPVAKKYIKQDLLAKSRKVPVGLKGFQLVPEIKTRIIKEEILNEK